ncbi:hypothetical protein [Cognaticolwellia aestuarii]|uniref:hypothetical protein n=1 Tax=Cognaticolwellia aestuarii TaxID=329993 RepID=UPI0009854CF1|nr:hypothetical protein [Cognaticolwellia aestuarii]
MKRILIPLSFLLLSACGGGSSSSKTEAETNPLPVDPEKFVLHNVRFDAKDYYDQEQVSIKEGTSFEVQWVSPSSATYKIDLYLSTNGEEHSDDNKIVELRCGSDSFSLCPNATGEVQCIIDDNTLSCSIDHNFVGSAVFLDEHRSSLKFIIKGCDALNSCDVKTFNLLLESK